jgi:hypothetical protein
MDGGLRGLSGAYKNTPGETVKIDPKNLGPNTKVVRF